MLSPREGSPRRPRGRRWALWAGLAVGGLLPSTGCQVEYGGMTLPSGKYMHDDVQYFPPGPEFRWANTQAATQRAMMSASGYPVDAGVPGATPGMPGTGPVVLPPPAGALDPTQNIQGRPTDINTSPMSVNPPTLPEAAPVPGPGGDVPPPGGDIPAPGGVPQ